MLLLVFSLISPAQAGRADKKAEKAAAAYYDLDMAKAFKHCSKAMRIDPGHVDANAVCGAVLMAIGSEIGDAEMLSMGGQLLGYVGSVEPEHPMVLSWAALVKMFNTPVLIPEPDVHCGAGAMGAWDKAEEAFGRGDIAGAREHYEVATASCDHPRLWTYYGDTFFNEGDLTGAIAAYDHALEIEPCYWAARRFKGDALAQMGRRKEAIWWTASAIACNPTYEPAWAYLQTEMDDRVPAARAMPKPDFAPGVLLISTEESPAPWSTTVQTTYGLGIAALAGSRLESEMLSTSVVLSSLREGGLLFAPGNELWQLLDEATVNGQQTEATYVLLLDAYLVDDFLAYRDDNLDKLTDYVLTLMR